MVLVDQTRGAEIPDPVTAIASPLSIGSLRIRLPHAVSPGIYFLKALNAHGSNLTRSADFRIG